MVLEKDKRADYNQELYRRYRDARKSWDTEARFDIDFFHGTHYSTEEVDELQYDKKGNVTGKNVYTYVIDKDNKRTEIGYKTYRSKNGAAGKTQNTMSYSKDMQDCFKGKK